LYAGMIFSMLAFADQAMQVAAILTALRDAS
jgi:hypothetical protein